MIRYFKPKKQKVFLTLAVVFGFYLIKDTWHWAIFLIGGSIATTCLYFTLINIEKLVRNIKHSAYKQVAKYFAFALLLIILTGVTWLASIGSGVFTGMPVPHFRTNIFTSECSLNTWNDQADPWFYTAGCSITKQVKIEMLKNDHRFNFVKKRCEQNGSEALPGWLVWDEVTCADLLEEPEQHTATSRPSFVETDGNSENVSRSCVANSDESKLYRNTKPEIEDALRFQAPQRANLSVVPWFRNVESDLIYTEVYDGRGLNLGGRFINESEWLCSEHVDWRFLQLATGVHVIDDEQVKQIIKLSDIDIGNPTVQYSTFTNIYGSNQSMWREQVSAPALITDFDVNFDGFDDLGILVDTGPIEDGYIFYLFDIRNELYVPATLDTSPDASFTVYQPSVDIENKILKSRFTVTNPRRVDSFEYSYNTETSMFTKRVE